MGLRSFRKQQAVCSNRIRGTALFKSLSWLRRRRGRGYPPCVWLCDVEQASVGSGSGSGHGLVTWPPQPASNNRKRDAKAIFMVAQRIRACTGFRDAHRKLIGDLTRAADRHRQPEPRSGPDPSNARAKPEPFGRVIFAQPSSRKIRLISTVRATSIIILSRISSCENLHKSRLQGESRKWLVST